MATVSELRAAREAVNAQIETLRAKATDLSAMIRQIEGPIPDRSHRDGRGRLGYTVAPTKPTET